MNDLSLFNCCETIILFLSALVELCMYVAYYNNILLYDIMQIEIYRSLQYYVCILLLYDTIYSDDMCVLDFHLNDDQLYHLPPQFVVHIDVRPSAPYDI